MNRLLLVAFAFLICTNLYSQMIFYPKYYTSIKEAMLEPDSVYALDLTNQNLILLPEEIVHFKNLAWLRANNNQLRSLPEWIGDLSKLEDLYLNNNQLTSLPESICKLKKLTALHLDNNRLTSLPACFAGFDCMTFIYLDHNPLTSWPAQIGSMKYTFRDSVWNSDRSKVAYVGISSGVYLSSDSFYLQRYVIILSDLKTGKTDTLLRSGRRGDKSEEVLCSFTYLTFSPDEKYIYFECRDVWEKSDAIHGVRISNHKEEFVVDAIGEYFFLADGQYAGNLLIVRYHYEGEGTGSQIQIISPKGKKVAELSDDEGEKLFEKQRSR